MLILNYKTGRGNEMKKLLKVLLVFCVILSLAGCGNKEQTVSYKIEQSGVEIVIKLDAKGDTITKFTQTSKIDLTNMDKSQEEQIDKTIEQMEEKVDNIEGVEYNTEEENNILTEVISIQTENEKTLQEVIDKQILPVTGGSNVKKLSLEKTGENLVSQGWSEVK